MNYSVIQKSQLEGATRIDAEYYQAEYLEISNRLKNLKTITLGEFCGIADGDHSEIPGFVDSNGVRYLRAKDLQDFFIDDSDRVFISKEYFKKIRRSHIKAYDIVLSIMGTVGNLAVILPEHGIVTANRAVSIISPNNQKLFSSYFIAAYLESKYGRDQRNRESMGGVQQRVNLEDLSNIKIPMVSYSMQKKIIDIFQQAINEFTKSKSLYTQAENLLLEELGLGNFKPDEDLWSEVNFSYVQTANRIDAEFCQPKYEELISKIKKQNSETLEKLIVRYSTGFPFRSNNYIEQGIPLIRINNIKRGYLDLSDTAFLTERDYSLSPKDTAKPGDIVLSMSGTIGMTAVIPEDIPKCTVNQRILKFTPKNIDKDFIALILNTIIGIYQLERIGTGGVQTNISYKDIKNILIPILPKATQQKIAELVKKSHEARRKSKELLEEAKRKVEEMIEKGANNGN